MTKKEFFTKKIIPRIEEQIFEYDFQLIRNQYILERLEKELEKLEKNSRYFGQGDNVEKILEEKERREEAELEQQIEEVKRNIAYLPLMKEEEEKFLEYFKELIEKL
jgi:microcompartment protein CcmL/EutN